MPNWPTQDETLIKQFVDQLNLACYSAPYQSLLRQFQRFVVERSPKPTFSEDVLRAWLRGQLKTAPLPLAVHRGQLVNRFLDWLAARESIAANPIAELRCKYECCSSAAVMRALASDQPKKALESLRPPPRYGSHLGAIMREHVDRMRTSGLRYRHENRFLHFDRFLQQRPGADKEPLPVLIREYTACASSAAGKVQRIQLGRVIAKELNRSGQAVTAPKRDGVLVQEMLRGRRRPHIYTVEEVQRLLEAARCDPSPRAPLRSHTLYMMLVLAYCTGLRLGEIVGLNLGDLDLNADCIEVHDTKFFKSRRLPLSATATAALRDYLGARARAGAPTESDAPLFWHAKGGYGYVAAGAHLRRLIRATGLKSTAGRSGPRVHDLRHAFVVHRMTMWYEQGINPQTRLPYLAAYLGHRNIHSTLVYLTITQELLQRQRTVPNLGSQRPASHPEVSLMPKHDLPTLPKLLHSFFHEWLVEQRNASHCTILAYRDAWRLFLRFVAQRRKKPVAALSLEHLTGADVLAFLQHIEKERRASVNTRNCRLAALRSFFSFVGEHEPRVALQCAEVLRVPFKKTTRRATRYLESAEVTAILSQPDRNSAEGQRDYTLMSLLYNTGARVQEALDLRPQDVHFKSPAHVRLIGKGRKELISPIWPETADLVTALMRRRPRKQDEPIFVNRYGEPLTASGFRFRLRQYVDAAAKIVPTISKKRVTPHVFRHSTAVHLVAAGVDVTVIRSWLGHAQLDTTNHYAQANLETKRKALEQVDPKLRPAKPPRWKRDADLLAWLDSL